MTHNSERQNWKNNISGGSIEKKAFHNEIHKDKSQRLRITMRMKRGEREKRALREGGKHYYFMIYDFNRVIHIPTLTL